MDSATDTQSAQSVQVYHERQSLMLCAIHSVNNLLQRNAVKKEQFDEICKSLSPDSWINPHRHILGIGNYDVNVIMAALQRHGYQTVWFDKRKSVNILSPDNIFGYLLNMPSRFPFPFHSKHWFAVRRIGVVYYNLDSKLSNPLEIGNILEYLNSIITSNQNVQLLLVVTDQVAESKSWQLTEA